MIRKLGATVTWLGAFAGALLFMLTAEAASALAQTGSEPVGRPHPWEIGLQPPADTRMRDIIGFHNFLLWIIVGITLFVLALLLTIIIRFNAKTNPVPSKTTHNTLLEVVWTVVPVIILVVIAIPSFRLLYFEDTIPPSDLTIEAIGRQWYWSYKYPDNGNFMYDSQVLNDADAAKAGEPRLLGVDNPLVVPVGKTIRVLTTSSDVIHSWALPAMGVKMDAVPGRINTTWFKPDKIGTYYGECSELCGARHAFMPIEVKVVSQQDFDTWVKNASKQYGSVDTPTQTRVAQQQ